MNLQADLILMLPELILALGAMGLLLVGALSGGPARFISWAAILLLIVAGVAVVIGGEGSAFQGAFIADGFSRFAKILILMSSAFCILLADEFFAAEVRFELPVLMLLATLGMLLIVSASSFLSLYMGLELQSLALYVLAAFNRDHLRSTEAGLKYFVLGALSSGMLLYGISLIYGFTGNLSFAGVAAGIAHSGMNLGLVFGLVFLVAGLAFKVSAVPFHMWTPDVYEGAPTPVTAYFATAAKAAAFCLFLRAMLTPFPDAFVQWRQIIIVISVLSMGLGAVAALGQRNIKRLMAYSSIGHMGYALLGLAAGTALGTRGVLIYLAIYVVTNLGVFAAIQAMRRGGKAVENIADLSGLARTDPKLALVFALLFLSLAGLPPLAGFFAKFYVFLAAIQAQLIWPAILGMLASAIGLVYYLRLVKIMYFDEPAPGFDGDMALGSRAILILSGAFALLFIFAASPIISAADAASKVLFPLTGWPQGYGLADYPELDSTNAQARRMAADGESGPLWITTARQTAGRGRRGRNWESPPGNLAATLLLRPNRPLAEWPQLSFAAAITGADMAAHFAPRARIEVKWPNDILADGRKVAGILLETAGDCLAIGIGVNLTAYPQETEFPATSLVQLGSGPVSAEAALIRLAQGFAGWYGLWREEGFAPIREAWLARAAGLGSRIRARLPDHERAGVFEGIDEAGALLLNEGTTTRAIAAGDVFFG